MPPDFVIRVKNKSNFKIKYSINLINSDYKMLNFDDRFVDYIRTTAGNMYEINHDENETIYLEIKQCYNQVEIFYGASY